MQQSNLDRYRTDGPDAKYDFSNVERPWRDEDILEELYVKERFSMPDIADILDCSYSSVRNGICDSDIRIRGHAEHKLSGPASFHTDSKGYECFRSTVNNKEDRFRHHQLLAIHMGADPFEIFKAGGVVPHHKNGIKWDNRPSNIEIMDDSEHRTQHNLDRQPDAPWRDKERLQKAYAGKSASEVAEEMGCCERTILNWLEEFNIEKREPGYRLSSTT